MIRRLLNLSLRGGGMVGKFLLIFLLARILTPSELGVYGLLAVTIGYSLYFLGLDFYTFSGREMLHSEKALWPSMLRDQAVLFACSYAVVFPSLALIFINGVISFEYALVFYLLLLAEHLSQELNRLLVIIGRPLAAGICIFIRSGSWCYVIVIVYMSGLYPIDLQSVLWTWFWADVVVIAMGAFLLKGLPWNALTRKVHWEWLIKGVKISALLLIGTLALRGIFTFDRYFVEYFADSEMLGVYTLYMGICFSLIGFVDAAIFSFKYPELIKLFKNGAGDDFAKARKQFGKQTLIFTSLLVIIVSLVIYPVLGWIGKPIYLQNLTLFFVLLAASFIFVIGHVPHFALYAMGQDRVLVFTHIFGLVVFVLIGASLYQFGAMGVALALLASISSLGAGKYWQLYKLNKLN